MTPDQVSGLFDAGESFMEGTIAALLVVLWVVVLSLFIARPYMVANLNKFTLRLGADLWWIIYVALRDLLLVNLFLGSFIYFYPDVVSGKDLPITGGLAAVCAFAVMLIKLIKGDHEVNWFRAQVVILALGAVLYVFPYLLGVQVTGIGTDTSNQLASVLVSSQNVDVALALCYLSAVLVGVMALIAVIYNFREASGRPSKEQTR
jgi:hypothetical protein